ncbi:RNA polymerase II mediator complex subunit [Myotisia sp. PD_48]|nr:RNA polymerase II mediator complex subunit [Myotisia sp. PD_48]
MADSLSLPLRPARKKTDSQDTLPIRIAQINAQRGSFREVTEQGLRDEIEAARASGRKSTDVTEDKKADDGGPDRETQLFTSRTEMLEFAWLVIPSPSVYPTQAQVEATFALDFISLALSKNAPRQAKASMSPLLKSKIPQGSLGLDRIKTPEKAPAEKKDIDTVSKGWKLESFNSAATNLLQAATRLEQEVAAETKYWADVLDIQEKGWKICRLPREKQTLGVQYGFLESPPTFRDRGLGALRRKNDGSVFVDQGIQTSPPQVVRVRVKESDKTIGLSQPVWVNKGDNSIKEAYIHKARDSLFEEELFYELYREARALLRHGVETRHRQIQFTVNYSRHVIVDLVDADEAASMSDPDISARESSADELAEGIGLSIRILLSHSHRRNHRRRTQVPPPLTVKKRPPLESQFLRPSLTYLQHTENVQWLTSFLENITSILFSAGLTCTFSSHSLESTNTPRDANRRDKDVLVEAFVHQFLAPRETLIAGHFLTPNCGYKILVRTDMSPSAFGTEFEVRTNLSSFPQQQTAHRFGVREDISEFLVHLFTLDLVHAIPSLGGTRVGSIPRPKLALLDGSYGSDDPERDVDATSSLPTTVVPIWEPVFPQCGELASYATSGKCASKLYIDLSEDTLILKFSLLRQRGGVSKQAPENATPKDANYNPIQPKDTPHIKEIRYFSHGNKGGNVSHASPLRDVLKQFEVDELALDC